MAAVIRAQIDAELPPELIRAALDSDMDGVEDTGLFDAIVGNAETLCRSHLGSAAASLPSDASTVPDAYREAVLASVCLVLVRRGRRDDKDSISSWADRQAKALSILDDIAAGKRSLSPVRPGRMIVSEPLQFGRKGGIA